MIKNKEQAMDKQSALIVGGAKSLGSYLARNLASNYKVIIFDIDKKAMEKTALKISKKVFTFKGDASKEKDIIKFFQQVSKHKIKIDLMVYNAGVTKPNKITKLSKKDLQWHLDVNLIGYALFCKHLAKHMIKNKIYGTIININSKSGKAPSKHNCAYAAAKAGALALTRSIALDLAQYNININSLMVGNLLDSPMFESQIPSFAKKLGIAKSQVKKVYRQKTPLNRGCSFEDVYNAICFYGSNKANYITGQAINITGGQVMY